MIFERKNLRAVSLAREFIAGVLRPGDAVVDATAGNGKDTLFLAAAVGPTGRVYAFDVQMEALEVTRRRLVEAGLDRGVEIIHDGHENMKKYVRERVRGVMFNLGYLPGGRREVITRPETTVPAVQAGLDLLEPGGRMSVVVYTGHPGAVEEVKAVEEFAAGLDPRSFWVLKVTYLNRRVSAPFLILIEKIREHLFSNNLSDRL